VVEAFLYAALRDKDFDEVGALMADDVVYENVGYSTLRGAERILRTFRRGASAMPWLHWDVEIHRSATEGSSVFNERTDSLIIGPFRADFWVCGVFELRDGKITLWRDYFDLLDLIKGTIRGLLAVVLAPLRRAPERTHSQPRITYKSAPLPGEQMAGRHQIKR
jgi:limonene-1,2-epoxide hydrolase